MSAAGRTLLLVEDDPLLREVLAEALGERGFAVTASASVAEARARLAAAPAFTHAVVDLSLPDGSGLGLVAPLAGAGTRTLVLTGYASVATAVEAVKLGAVHYLTKPADADDVVAAFARTSGDPTVPVPERPMSPARVEWEHIQRVLTECGGNISEAARRMGMHRRTLQRKLRKRPVRR